MQMLTATLLILAAAPVPLPVGEAKKEIYPLAMGNKWEYKMEVRGKVIEMAQEVTKVLEVKKGPPQITISTSGDNIVAAEVLSVDDKGVYRHSFNGIEIPKPYPMIKLPIKIGTKWKNEFTVAKIDVVANSEILEEETVKVEAGEFKAFPVRAVMEVMGQTMTFKTWYAVGVGVVKQEADAAGTEIKMELVKFTPAKSP